ncbi:MAG: arsenite methyltransferase, partial [Planctomycetota bacterium]
MQNLKKDDEIRQAVRKTYGDIAKSGASSFGSTPSTCCGDTKKPKAEDISVRMGYSAEDVSELPEGANMGLG